MAAEPLIKATDSVSDSGGSTGSLLNVLMSREKKTSHVPVEEQVSCCDLCQDVLKDPVSTSCGHWFCRQCITSYWDQSGPSGDSSCPQCGQRSRSRPGLQTASQTRTVQSKTEHLSANVIISESRTCCFLQSHLFYHTALTFKIILKSTT
uniref:RING-type domain-containing protein n=1 Tax=Lates calcarifer TaxID=8187 RepID=A0A4W6FN83_LATCA